MTLYKLWNDDVLQQSGGKHTPLGAGWIAEIV